MKNINSFRKFSVLRLPICVLLVAVTLIGSTCEKSKPNATPTISTWKCSLTQNATIILTIDEPQSKMYVSTHPQDLRSLTGMEEMFRHGDTMQYVMSGDTMLLGFSNSGYGWIKTMFSADSMQLDYWGNVITIANLRTRYLFIRQTSNI
jgi:hypothetical protein